MRLMRTDARERHQWTAVPSVGVRFHARTWPGPPAATPLVLVAGLGVSSRYWARLGRRLSDRYLVYAADLPGFGRTPPPPGAPWPAGPNVREQADQLLAWMDAGGIGRAVLFGHSVGCQTVVDLATRFPERVARVILAAPPFEPGRRSLASSLPRLAMGALFEVPSLPLLLCAEYASAGPARAIQQAVRSMDYPMELRLPLVPVPTLVIHGAFDPLVSRRWVDTVARLVPGAMLVVVEQVGHAMHYSAAAVTARVVDRYLRDDLTRARPTPPDEPRRDPFAPPQPIPASASRVMGATVAAAVLWACARGRGNRWARAVAAVSLAMKVGPVPPVVRASVDATGGTLLLAAGTIGLRRRPPAVRGWAVGFGLFLMLTAVLAAKPTGPARRLR